MSQFLNDLAQANAILQNGMSSLQENLQRLKQQRVIGSANEMVQQIKASEADEQEKITQLREIASNLTLQLAQANTPAATMDLIGKAVVPPRQTYQTPEQAIINEGISSPQAIQAQGLLQQKAEQRKEELLLKRKEIAAVASDKKERRLQDIIIKTQDKFASLSKKGFEMIDSASTLRTLLNQNNPVADQSVPTFAAKASGEVGALSEADKAAFGGSQAIHRKLARFKERAISGKLTDADRKDLLKLTEAFERGGKSTLTKRASLLAKQRASTLGISEEEILEQILPESFLNTPEQPQLAPSPQPSSSLPSIPGLKLRTK